MISSSNLITNSRARTQLEYLVIALALTFVVFSVTCLTSSEAFAMHDDSMKAGLTTLETFLTGNILRLMVIGGSVYGAYQAYVASKPGLLGGAIATGLGVNFLMTWAKSTWAMIL